ncbi:winged helix-turn-helix domain-containing protein [Lentzea flava]|uniref:Transcriptional regulator n=1 Tax=Lentzea flava TaxID=103732 RepID=A0ABQ2VAY7_9PSEU|nr:helix-turn-helix domain-containing protein [Lentzea flava]MCP2204278.1 Helix-turn-helix domain-containing protein [Lentzea flava]GGU75996.1 transcriptional regulator [Lentzea flava]
MTDPRVRDPKALRALSHPFRWKLIHVLTEGGPLTATQCSEKLDESVASCSYHLNMLAKYGFVEEVQGPGRQKPWRITRARQSISPDGLDPEGAMAAETAALAYLDQEFERIRERLVARKLLEWEWRDSVGTDGSTKFLTAEELAEYKNELQALLTKYNERMDDPSLRPEGSRAVRIFLGVTVATD